MLPERYIFLETIYLFIFSLELATIERTFDYQGNEDLSLCHRISDVFDSSAPVHCYIGPSEKSLDRENHQKYINSDDFGIDIQ